MQAKTNTVFDCTLVKVKSGFSPFKHSLTVSSIVNIPFVVRRIYYIYEVPLGEERGGHSHYQLEQYIIALHGSFDIILNDGSNEKKITLDNPETALHIVPGIWRKLENFTKDTICVVLASEIYNEKDYIR